MDVGYRAFEAREWSDDQFWRLWFWQGILVVGGELLVAAEDDSGNLALSEIDRGALIFNFHAMEQPKTVLIQVVRESALLPYVDAVRTIDHDLAVRMYESRSAQSTT